MLPREFRVELVDESTDPVLRNLFEHYLHDMAQWFEFDTQSDGRYECSTREMWDKPFTVYFAYAGAIPIGFGLVGSAEAWTGDATVLDMDEFFVIRRYRRHGVGAALANHIWDQHPGPWLVRVLRANLPAMPFWRGIVAARSGNDFQEQTLTSNQRLWSYLTFANPPHLP